MSSPLLVDRGLRADGAAVDRVDRTLVSVFRDAVASHGTRSAVESAQGALTYQQLDARSDAVAIRLIRGGVRVGDLVGLWVPRSAAMYVGLLGILKAGAGYVPCDAESPPGRAAEVLHDAGVVAIVSTESLIGNTDRSAARWELLLSEALDGGLDAGTTDVGSFVAGVDLGLGLARSTDIAYVIYTSGSSGRPKGVVLSHRNVLAFIDAEAEVFDVTWRDRVWQGFSVAFDASVEELWLAWCNGATLVCATQDQVRSGPDLPEALRSAGVTVLSCVPTLLSMAGGDIPGVRLLILGGEVCPPELARRWCRPGRRVFNTYGPTETTVVATACELSVGKPVRIGTPLPSYLTWVVNKSLELVPDGTAGELLIGGPAVSQGYLGRPELTAEKFIVPPWGGQERVYRSGDLVRVDDDGYLEFLGRIDDQVKLRGHRIELGEVDDALHGLDAVATAATALRSVDGFDVLVAYVCVRSGSVWDEDTARQRLSERLPGYMVPGRFVLIDAFPRLTSGKIDRKSLPDPPSPCLLTNPNNELSGRERQVQDLWMKVLGRHVEETTNFFLVGGDSLAATEVVSHVRGLHSLGNVSVRDLYHFPTLALFSSRLDEIDAAWARQSPTTSASLVDEREVRDDTHKPRSEGVSNWRFRCCTAAQTLSLWPLLVLMSPPWLITFVVFYGITTQQSQHRVGLAAIFAVLLFSVTTPARIVLCVLVKWLVLGRVRPGRYRLWGLFYFRFWLVNRVMDMMSIDALSGTPIMSRFYRLMGAQVGRDVHIATTSIGVYDLLRIGDGATIDDGAILLGYQIADGWLHVGSISIGAGARVGVRAMAGIHTVIGDDAELTDGSMLPEGGRIPPRERWDGSPARLTEGLDEGWPLLRPPATRTPTGAYVIGFLVLALIPVLAAIPEAVAFAYIDNRYCDFTKGYFDIWKLAAATPLAALSFVVVLSLLIAAAKRVAMPTIEAGVHAVSSVWHVQKWFVDSLLNLSLDLLFPIYASVYLPPWLRLMGATLGRDVEVSTVENLNPDLLTVNDGAFVADAVSLGAAQVHRGWVRLEHVSIGSRAFIGNSAVIPAGTVIGPDVLIGVQSAPPREPTLAAKPDSSWLGRPAIELHTRAAQTTFADDRTFRPTRTRKVLRAFIEFWRIILPSALVSLGSLAVFLVAEDVADPTRAGLGPAIVLFPFMLLVMGLLLALAVVVAKWILIGRYRAQERPLWDSFVWRSELVNALHENVSMRILVRLFLGTPLLPIYFRLLGANIGKSTCMWSSNLTEFDLVYLEDEVQLNDTCDIQTHLFEDRVMKMSSVHIGAGASIGAASVVLYDANVEENSRIDGASLIMKGERIPAGTRWHGSPAERVDAPQLQP